MLHLKMLEILFHTGIGSQLKGRNAPSARTQVVDEGTMMPLIGIRALFPSVTLPDGWWEWHPGCKETCATCLQRFYQGTGGWRIWDHANPGSPGKSLLKITWWHYIPSLTVSQH